MNQPRAFFRVQDLGILHRTAALFNLYLTLMGYQSMKTPIRLTALIDFTLCTIFDAFGSYYALGPLVRHCSVSTLATRRSLLFSVLSHMALQRVCSTKCFIASWADIDRRCVCWISVSVVIPELGDAIAYFYDVCSCSTHHRCGNHKTHTAAAFRPCGSSYV